MAQSFSPFADKTTETVWIGALDVIKSFDELVAQTRAMEKKTKIALCCAQDLHALEAIARARREGLADAILIGDPAEILSLLEELGESPANYTLHAAENETAAVRIAAELVQCGDAGVIMKGKMQTADLMRGVLKKENGLRAGQVLSVCGNYQMKDAQGEMRILTVTDPALNVRPNLETKKAMLENAIHLRNALGDTNPKVAIIAANELVNPKIPESVDAAELKEMAQAGTFGICKVEGPISLDLALNPDAVASKGYKGEVAGDANILVMPDLISANVLAKSITDIAGNATAGVVMGAKVPMVLVSRASPAEDKFNSIALASFISQQF